jgi:hypothetical protein
LSFSNSLQGSEFLKPAEPSAGLDLRNVSTMPAPKKLVQLSSNGMAPPLPRTMPPAPPPPKFTTSTFADTGHDKNNIPKKTKSDSVPGKGRSLICFALLKNSTMLMGLLFLILEAGAYSLYVLFILWLQLLVFSDTLVKLMEYGEEDDDPEESYEESVSGKSSAVAAARKPFWAL